MTDQPTGRLSAEEIAEIKARADAVTSGPWTLSEGYNAVHVQAGYWWESAHIPHCLTVDDPDFDRRHAVFFAHSRTDIPLLLTALEATAGRSLRPRWGDGMTKIPDISRWGDMAKALEERFEESHGSYRGSCTLCNAAKALREAAAFLAELTQAQASGGETE